MANILRKAARSLLRPAGFVDVTQGSAEQAQSSLNRIFRAIGLSLYSPSSWKLDDYIEKGYADNATLYSVVNRIMRTAAMAPFKVYRVKDQAKHLKYKAFTGSNATAESLQQAVRIKSLTYEEDTTHELNKLIEKPNKYMGGNEFTQLSIGYKLLTGNRIWFKNILDAGANAGKPIAIYNLPPQCGNIIAGNILYDIIAYEFNMVVNARIEPNLIIHSRYPNFTFDGSGSHLWGMAPLSSGRRSLDRSNKAERRAVTLLDKAGAAGLLFNKSPNAKELDPVKEGKLKYKLNSEILGSENAAAIAIANGDLGYINFGQTAVNMDIINQEKYTDEKICNIFHAPPGLWSASANATDNNIKAWMKQLITQAVIPELSSLRDDWNEVAKAYKDSNLYVDYSLECYPELLEDMNQLATRLEKMWYYTGQEKRLMTGGDEDLTEPMLNKYFIPSSLKEISDANPDYLQDELNILDNDVDPKK